MQKFLKHEPEKEVDKLICYDDSRCYMGIENSEIISSVEETEVVFSSVEKAQIKRTLSNMLSFHELYEKRGMLSPKTTRCVLISNCRKKCI